MTSSTARRLRDRALALGFDHVGTCPPPPSSRDTDAYRRWIADGMAGEMSYMRRPDRVARALDPRGSLPGVRSLVVVALGYHTGDLAPEECDDPSRGRVAAYARGQDYHAVMLPRLTALAEWLSDALGRPVAHRAMVDFGPLLERDAAARAGLGFVGRNTMLIHPRQGSWSFLGVLLVDVDLDVDEVEVEVETSPTIHSSDEHSGTGCDGPPAPGGDDRAAANGDLGAHTTCGRCTRCLDACPTGAFAAPYVLDARRCISYLTIELKGPIPRELRAGLGNRVFGCDVCNDVCPYNRRFARPAAEPAFRVGPDRATPPLLDLLALDEHAFRARYAGTALLRAKRRGLLRNVCVAIGNWADPVTVPALEGVLGDPEPLVRGHAAWALGQIGARRARAVLSAARAREPDSWVRDEITLALAAPDAE